MNKTLQEQYNLIKEGKGNKQQFFKSARHIFPDLITPVNTFEDTVTILKNRGVISENIGGLVTKGKTPDWHSIFNENMGKLKEDNDPTMSNPSFIIKSIPNNLNPELKNKLSVGKQVKIIKKWKNATGSNEFLYGLDVSPENGLTAFEINQLKDTKESEKQAQDKARSGDSTQAALQGIGLFEAKEAKAEEKEPTKDVVDMETKNYDYKDKKNYDNVFGQEFLKGFYTEMGDSKNEGKTVEELRAIVAKNLAKDINHYVKDGQFGVKGVGYTTEAPGLGTPKEAKGKYKASGYSDLKESLLRTLISEMIKEVLAEELEPGSKEWAMDLKKKSEDTSLMPADRDKYRQQYYEWKRAMAANKEWKKKLATGDIDEAKKK